MHNAILDEINLPLKLGLTLDEINVNLGTKPFHTQSYILDRTEYEYQLPEQNFLYVSCTVDQKAGLVHLVIVTDPRTRTP